MARPRKIVDMATGKIGKQARLNRQTQEAKLKVGREQIEAKAPAWLTDRAAQEFNRVVREAATIGLFDNLDLAILAIYASNYDRYVEASEHLHQDGLAAGGKFGDIPSPYIRIAGEAAKQVMQCSTKLGLAATDRLKLVVPTAAEEKAVNKYLRFL